MATSPGEKQEGAATAPSAGARLYDLLGYVGGVILAAMTAAVFAQVILRYLGLTGIDGIEEIPRYLFVWLVMIGGAAAMWRNEHTTLDYFQNLLPAVPRALLVALVNAAGIVLFGYLIHLSITLVPNAGYQTSSGLGLTLDYVFAAIPFGAALMIPPMLRNVYFALRTLWRKHS
ncbi:MAG: TRAP transporter small permease [Alphaproteobacteria bacterium]|nr:TRAP transporter small permease [Alphaproteobacteria bacterium]